MKLMATAIITLFATVALAEGTAAPKAPAAPAAPVAAAPAAGTHAEVAKTCEGKKGADLKKCEEEAKKAHSAHH